MQKIIRLTLLALLVSAAVTACGGGSDDSPPTTEAAQTIEPTARGADSSDAPLDDLAARLEEEGLAIAPDQAGDAKAVIKAGPVKVAEYPTTQEAQKVEREISEVFSGDEISGEGRVAVVGKILVYVADEHALSRSKEAAFETVVAALKTGE